jgi:hypothetical protein
VAKPKTKPYTVKKVDRKVILTTPQHGKNRSKSNNTTTTHQDFVVANSLIIMKKIEPILS